MSSTRIPASFRRQLHQAAVIKAFSVLGKDTIQMHTIYIYFYTLDRPIKGRVVHVWHCSIFFPAVCMKPFFFFFLFCFKQCWLLLIFINDFVHRLHHFDSLLLHWLTFLYVVIDVASSSSIGASDVCILDFFHVMNLAHLVLAWHFFFIIFLLYFEMDFTCFLWHAFSQSSSAL